MARFKAEAILVCFLASITAAFGQSIRLSIPAFDLVQCSVSIDATVEIDISGPSPFAVDQETTKSSSGYQNVLLFVGGIQQSSSGLYTCTVIQNGIIVERETFQLDGTSRRLVSARITTTPTPVMSGNNFTIMCSVILAEIGTTSPGSAEIQWIAPDQTILPSSISNDTRSVSTSFNTSTLIFSPALTSQTGEYICRANFSNVINTDSYQLDVSIPIPAPEVSVTIDVGSTILASANATLTCNVTLRVVEPAMVTVVWQRPGQAQEVFNDMVTSNGIYISTIQITSATAADQGIYTCTANLSSSDPLRDPSGTASDIVTITVILPRIRLSIPEANSVLCSVPVLIDATVEIDIGVSGPFGVAQNTTESSSGYQNNLLFEGGIQPNSSGVYTCTFIQNGVIVESETFELDGTSRRLVSARITTTPTPVMSGNNFTIMCSVILAEFNTTSPGSAEIQWIAPDQTILPSSISNDTRSVSTSFNTSTLIFSPALTSQTGEYICRANFSNVINTDSYQLNVTNPIPAPEVSVTIDVGSTIPASANATLTCNVTLRVVEPAMVTVVWQRPGQAQEVFNDMVTSNGTYISTIQITSATAADQGIYTCTANLSSSDPLRDPSGTASDMITITVILPVSPLNITSVTMQQTQVIVDWVPLASDVIDRYHITVSDVITACDFSRSTGETISGSVTTYTASGLEELSKVTIVIIAENLAGNFTVATERTNTTAAEPSGIPLSLTAMSSTGTSITIFWERVNCTDRNTVIEGYTITYFLTDNNMRVVRQAVAGSNQAVQGTSQASRTVIVAGLLPRRNYTFQVAPVSSSGMSGPMATLVASTAVPSNVGLYHRGIIIANNSILLLDDVGTALDSLICFTSDPDCCSLSAGQELGQWLNPDESEVNGTFSQGRGLSLLTLNNERASENDTGLFQCQIPDSQGVNQTLFIGIYNTSQGLPVLESLEYRMTTGYLVARSNGGPAQTVLWNRNGSAVSYNRSQSVTNVSLAAYENFLFLSDTPSNIIGTYTCQIYNGMGTSRLLSHDLQGVTVTGLNESYEVGDLLMLNCSTDLLNNRMSWQTDGALTLAETTDKSYVILSKNVTIEMDQQVLRCRSDSPFGEQIMRVTISVMAESTRDLRGAIAGGVVGGIVLIILIIIVIVLICCICCQLRSNKAKSRYIEESVIGEYRATEKPVHEQTDEEERPDLEVGEGYGHLDNNEAVDTSPKEEPKSFIVNEGAMYEESTFHARDREDAIPVPDFQSHVEHMHVGKNFETEYNQIPRTPVEAYDVGNMLHNKTKNRFGNIFPYDGNRVILKALSGVKGSDYINASFIDVYDRKKVYIASQGPTPDCVGDFWRMVWEYRTPAVVMLARCYEDGKKKCEQYWPEKLDDEMKTGENLCVTLKSSMPFVNYTIRKMSLRNSAEPDIPPLEVSQFHFQAWPDHGVPINAMSLIHFIKQVRKVHPHSNSKPVTVHCSAGVGRTGTFITMDYMLDRIPKKNNLNVFHFVKYLRSQRMLMVQTLAQYEFIHDALNEYIICGDTEITAPNMRATFNDLQKMAIDESTEEEKTKLQMQFELLDEVTSDVPTTKYVHAKAPCNADKNRFSKRIPNYFTRVRLRPTGQEGSDYINASFIDGYKRAQAFVCTQGCLENTVDDIWRMIFEYRCKCIVMLCDLNENFKEQCEQYWPDETFSPVKYGKLTVVKTTEENFKGYIVRKFEVTGTPPKSLSSNSDLSPSFVVTQFQYMEWPELQVPETSTTILEIIDGVKKVQISSGNKSILVMCNDGVGRSGSFMGIYSQLERIDAEGTMDLFQYIKATRLQRAALLLHKEQYEFCHQVIADYVDKFATYSNFKN